MRLIRTAVESLIESYEEIVRLFLSLEEEPTGTLKAAIGDADKQIILLNRYLADEKYLTKEYVSRLDLSVINYVDNNKAIEYGLDWKNVTIDQKNTLLNELVTKVNKLNDVLNAI